MDIISDEVLGLSNPTKIKSFKKIKVNTFLFSHTAHLIEVDGYIPISDENLMGLKGTSYLIINNINFTEMENEVAIYISKTGNFENIKKKDLFYLGRGTVMHKNRIVW